MASLLLVLCGLAVGFAAGWLLKPAGDRLRGRCGVPIGGGRHCRGRLGAGARRCWRHPEFAASPQAQQPVNFHPPGVSDASG